MNRIALLALPLALVAGAVPASAQRLPEGQARIGQTIRVDGPTVRPIAVIEDSRCPASADCMWQGRVILRVEVGTGRRKQRIDLHWGTRVHVADGTLMLVQITPERLGFGPIRPRDYRFTFRFDGSL